jgi:hypothetical protein
MKKILILLLCLGLCSLAFAQPQISGPQSGNLGPGSYLVVGDIQVLAGNRLTIAPGTTFLHNGNWRWTINGTLQAVGTAQDSIKFVRQLPNDACRWFGIRFETGASAGNILSYCVVEYCYHSTSFTTSYGAGIYSNGIPVTISHTRVSNCLNNCDGGGIYINNAAANLNHCTITDNTAANSTSGGGITLNGCTNATISYNVLARNSSTGT